MISPGSLTVPTAQASGVPSSGATSTPTTGAAAGVTRSGATAIVPGRTTAGTGGSASGMPVSITVSGKYFVLERFLGALEDLPRALVVNSVALAPADATAGSGSGTSPTLSATVSLTAYTSSVLADASPTPVPSSPGAAGSQP